MQITVEISDKLGKELKKITNKQNNQEEIVKKAISEKVERIKKFQNDPFTKWILNKNTKIKDKSDVSANHDKYLYGDKK